MKLGAQLFTLRDYCKTTEDFAATLQKVADIGYTTVQVSGTCAYEPAWLAEELKKTGLRCVITHTSPIRMRENPRAVISDHRVFDCRYIGLGSFPEGAAGIAHIDRFISDFLPVARTIRDHGAYMMYHNHQFEFGHDESGMTYLDKLLEAFPADCMGLTLDTYWVQAGGGNPATWLRRSKGRVPCIHLKDCVIVGTEQRMAAVGDGNIHFDEVIAAAEEAGTEYLLVEQDNTYGRDPFDELKRSYNYLRAMGLS